MLVIEMLPSEYLEVQKYSLSSEMVFQFFFSLSLTLSFYNLCVCVSLSLSAVKF
jgi:hypothetical protein